MRPSGLLRPLQKTSFLWYHACSAQWPPPALRRDCSCSPPLSLSAKGALPAKGWKDLKKRPNDSAEKQIHASKNEPSPDHRQIGTALSLFTTHPSSPGAPFFLPDGMHILQKLTSFIRAQYPAFGFREVLTPTLYKESLWEQSGHWANYKDDMFTVTGSSTKNTKMAPAEFVDGRMQPRKNISDVAQPESYGLKPMNCPGHCLLFQSQRRSYRDLPIRYADFSPLHRNEISGALSGLTRVRRFHQDDGHIFCRPNQVGHEITRSLEFVKLVYNTLDLRDYRFVLSTRPKNNYIGELEEWDRAEEQLTQALDGSGMLWRTNKGDGAFYGPKIDTILRDSDGKEHQTATVQLDFQLPKRFELGYEAPAPELEAKGEETSDPNLRSHMGTVRPVMIHRAILGSLERFLALLLEHHNGQLPFWLSPRQIIILTVTDNANIVKYANDARNQLSNLGGGDLPKELSRQTYIVHVDDNGDSIAKKIVRAKKKKYNMICVVGQRNAEGSKRGTIDVDVSAQPDQRKTWDTIEIVKPGSQAPIQKDKPTGTRVRGTPGVFLTINECKALIKGLGNRYL